MRKLASRENDACKKLRVFRGAAKANAKALRQDTFGVFKDYPGSWCGRG